MKPYTPGLLRIQVPAGKTKAGLSKPASVRLATGLNERLRFLKYGPGEFFEKHCDGCFRREISNGSGGGGEEFSLFTLHLYLNDDDADGDTDGKGLVGGATSFFSPWNRAQSEVVKEVKVKPKIGRVLIFQQADLLHSGEEVIEGLKLTMRTDIMYTTSV